MSHLGVLRTRVRAVISLLLAAVAAVAMSATGVVLATSSAGASGSAPTITNGIAAFTVGENEPRPAAVRRGSEGETSSDVCLK